MIPISPSWIVAGVVIMAAGGYIVHCEHVKGNWNEAKAIADRQNAENAKQALRENKAKERSDENYKRNISRLAADIKRLRDTRPSFLPPASPSSPDPSRIAFDRAELDAALRVYREEILGVIEEGAKAVEGLDEAKTWSQGR